MSSSQAKISHTSDMICPVIKGVDQPNKVREMSNSKIGEKPGV